MDPAVIENGILTTKSDVYSFGVVLLEIITRKKAVDGMIVTFARSFDEAHANGEELHMFDEGTENMKFLEDIVHLAAKCLLVCVRMRPEMSEVVSSLRRIRNTMQREQEIHQFGLRMDYQGINLRDFFITNGRQVFEKVTNNYNFRCFTEAEIRVITNNYSTLLGNGAFAQVYKGMLNDGSPVAVKRCIHWNGTQEEDFAKEVIVHSQINHKNVVRLLGCCTEENSLMIVMEFISNGNLSSVLHCNSGYGPVPFPLDKRLNIAIEVAEGLGCMHSMYSPVLHGDIKPDNILLDENLVPKISDFGLARLLCANGAQHTKNIIGSIGYLDPAVCENGILSPKSDVYSFGVVLLEIITRKKAKDGLAQSFSDALAKGKKVLHIFDEEISGKENMQFLQGVVSLAANCLHRDVTMRPKMVEVAASLRMIREAISKKTFYDARQAAREPAYRSIFRRFLRNPRNKDQNPPKNDLSADVPAIPVDELRKVTEGFGDPPKNDLSADVSAIPVDEIREVTEGFSDEANDLSVDVRAIPMNEIRKVTKNFDHKALIGDSYGHVYFGCLRNGRVRLSNWITLWSQSKDSC